MNCHALAGSVEGSWMFVSFVSMLTKIIPFDLQWVWAGRRLQSRKISKRVHCLFPQKIQIAAIEAKESGYT